MRRSIDRKGIGGFTEAILALMVVTTAVMILSLSLALNVSDLKEDANKDRLDQAAECLLRAVLEDHPLWRGDDMVWTGLELRSQNPYAVPDPCIGYSIAIKDLCSGERWNLEQGNLTDGTVQVLACQMPVSILSPMGDINAGLMTIEVW